MDADSFDTKDLAAPVKSFRLFALERAMQLPPTESLLGELQARQELEEDEECRILLKHVVTTLRKKMEKSYSPPQAQGTEGFEAAFASADVASRLEMLESLSRQTVTVLSPIAPRLLEGETDAFAAAKIIRVFHRSWPRDRLKDLCSRLFSASLSVRIAVLEALTVISPDLLTRDFPKLLTYPDPRVRALAIRGLSAIDPEEALLHLEALLMSADPSDKRAGLQNCLLLPFLSIKPLLLKFLASESDVSMLGQAGDILLTNPDPEVPYHLWETVERSEGAKKQALHALVTGICSLLGKSGVLGEGYKSYLETLQTWVRQRAGTRFVQECVMRFSEQDSFADPEFESRVAAELEKPWIVGAFKEAIEWRISDSARSRIREVLDRRSSQAPQATSPVIEDWVNLPHDAKIRRIGLLGEAEWGHEGELVRALARDGATPPEIRAAAIRAMLRMNEGGLGEAVRPLLKNPHPGLVIVALDYLSRFDPDFLFPLLGKFLNSNDPKIRTCALRILKRFDSTQALSTFRAMLSARSPRERSLALAYAIHFDFPLIRDTLAAFLVTGIEKGLLETGLYLFQSNPDFENLYCLFGLGKALDPEGASLAKTVREHTFSSLAKTGLLKDRDPASLEREFEARWQKEQARKAVPRPAYAYSPPEPRLIDKLGALTGSLGEWLLRPARLAVVLGGIIFLCIITLWSGTDQPEARNPRQGAVLSQSVQVRGTILTSDPKSGRCLLRTDSGLQFDLSPRSEGFGALKQGTKVTATLLPFRVSSNNRIQCNIQSLKREKP